MNGVLRSIAIGAFLLAGTCGVQAQTPGRDGDTWGGHRHPPTETELEQKESAAAVAAPRSQEASDGAAVDRIYRQLMGLEHPPG